MQLKLHLLILSAVLPFLSAGSENLLPEWEQCVPVKGKYQLNKWRIYDWGSKYSADKTPAKRSSTVAAADSKLTVTLENSPGRESVNMLSRTVKLPAEGRHMYRFSMLLRSGTAHTPLVNIRISSYSGKYFRKECYATAGTEAKRESIEFTTFPGVRNLHLSISLCGGGKVTVSGCRLEKLPLPPESELRLKPAGDVVILPKKNPAEILFTLPAGRSIPVPGRVMVTLPWGIRLINVSAGEFSTVSLRPKEDVTYAIKFKKNLKPDFYRSLILLLASDLAVGTEDLTGSIRIEHEGVPAAAEVFPIKIMKDIEAVPPRRFIIGLPGNLRLSPNDATAESESLRLHSGANVFTAYYTGMPAAGMRSARISHWPFFYLSPVRQDGHCNYSRIRQETFWNSHFIPALKTRILRYNRAPEFLLCDYRLGQGRAIDCICSLCRAELADFVPSLPRRRVMNYSNGMLLSRFRSELNKFRKARLDALREAALEHLPVGSGGFSRRPRFMPLFPLFTAFDKDTLDNLSHAVIDFGRGLQLPDGEKYNAAVNSCFLRKLRESCRKSSRSCRIFLRMNPDLQSITPEILQFEIINTMINGYSGVILDMPICSGYYFHAAVAAAAGVLRDYEKFLLRSASAKHSWRLEAPEQFVKLPPVPDIRNYLLALPERFPVLQLKVWKNGNETLVGIGNFSGKAVQTALACSQVSPVWRGDVDGTAWDARGLKKGIPVDIPGYSWRFFHFRGM